MEQIRWKGKLVRLAAAALLLPTAQSSVASGLDWKFSSSLNYESGTYGTGTRSSSLYVPFTLRRDWEDFHASLTVPFLSQTTDGGVRNVGGRPGRVARGTGSTAASSRSGLGDVVLRGGYAFMQDYPQPFDLSAVGILKVPTADTAKGLGTGESDAGLGFEFGKLVVPGWTALADVYYTRIGDPPGMDLNDQVAVDAGFSHLLNTGLTLTVLLGGSNALVSGESGARDLRGILDYGVNEHWSVHGGGLAGLSDGSADHGFSLGGHYRF